MLMERFLLWTPDRLTDVCKQPVRVLFRGEGGGRIRLLWARGQFMDLNGHKTVPFAHLMELVEFHRQRGPACRKCAAMTQLYREEGWCGAGCHIIPTPYPPPALAPDPFHLGPVTFSFDRD